MKIILLTIAGIIAFFAVIVGLGLFGLEYKKFFGPKHEEVRREIFEGTKSYNEGKAMELEKLKLEYLREKDPDSKAALANALLHKFADYDKYKLSPEQRGFLKQLEQTSINY